VQTLATGYWISLCVPKPYTSPLSVWSPVAIECTTYPNIHENIHFAHTLYLRVSHDSKNSYYFPNQIYLFFRYNAGRLCSLRSKKLIFVYKGVSTKTTVQD